MKTYVPDECGLDCSHCKGQTHSCFLCFYCFLFSLAAHARSVIVEGCSIKDCFCFFLGCDMFEEAFFSWVFAIIIEKLDPIVSLTLSSSTPAFLFLFSQYLFIPPLFHLSSNFFSHPLPFPSLFCHSLLFSVTLSQCSSLILYSTGERKNDQAQHGGSCFSVCVLIHSH